MSDGWIGGILIGLGILVIAAVNILAWQNSHEWHESPYGSDTMRRKVNGKWQYRPMTEEEAQARFESEAW